MAIGSKVLIIDYGVGNYRSVAHALQFLDCQALVSSKDKDIADACSYILPGVGAFNEAMKNLNALDPIYLA